MQMCRCVPPAEAAGLPDGQHRFYELIQFLSGYLATASSGSGVSADGIH